MSTGILWGIIVVLCVVWLVSYILARVTGPLIHILLVVAVILMVWNLVAGRGRAV